MPLLGKAPVILARTAPGLQHLGTDIVDLNMGCPMRQITSKGKGAVLMRDVPAAARILRALRRAITWDAFWSGGISNPLEVIEQITYLLFLRRLDDLHTLEENKSARLKQPIERRVFPAGKAPKKRPYDDLRWSRFKHFAPAEMLAVGGEHVFPFLRMLGGDDSTYAHHMKDARFTIPTPALLAKVVDLLDQVPREDRDTNGDLYEYMLGKIAIAGTNGQFRTPRHMIRPMVEMTAPGPKDVICDPACGISASRSPTSRRSTPRSGTGSSPPTCAGRTSWRGRRRRGSRRAGPGAS